MLFELAIACTVGVAVFLLVCVIFWPDSDTADVQGTTSTTVSRVKASTRTM